MTTFEHDRDEFTIQGAIEAYFEAHGSFAADLASALNGYPAAVAALARLGRDHVRYIPVGRGYHVVFLGRDGRIGTVEDHKSYPAKKRALAEERLEPGEGWESAMAIWRVEGTPDFRLIFEQRPARLLVLTARLQIIAASDAYLLAANIQREEIVGRHLSEIFVGDLADVPAPCLRHLQASLDQVRQLRSTDVMIVQRPSVALTHPTDHQPEQRHWRCVNTPVVGPEGDVVYVVHQVEDVTGVIRRVVSG